MSEEVPPAGREGKPAANQQRTEPMPADGFQSAPTSGNLGSADPQAPTPIAQSAIDGGVPRPKTARRGPVPGRPGEPEPDTAAESRRSGDGSGPTGGRPSGEVLPDEGGRVKGSDA
jgi:hypothetical protein